ncbi:ferric reductase-like transmembrane domain-containing protein [Streptomyces apocyni]|uniref:ferric reductase-like transmembrane domain-containing protein n=1 Tax=Streptomyces apocyni TaxID=2654677 RepID=UPI001E40C879|nr:ferric reductase-like transmembrane domain-containing protein [Streptomyces apocyni]
MNPPHARNPLKTLNPLRTIASWTTPSGPSRGMMSAAALLLIPLTVLAGSDSFREGLDFTTGVLSLVSLTASVVWGLVAADRLFLTTRQRLLAQAVHRATGVAAVGFLLLHGTVKLVLGHVSLVGALIPFGLGVRGTDGLIGLGSLAGLLMITAGVTGALRSAFASPAKIAGRWRALHMLAYPAWCAGLLHGLYAGREAKPWVTTLYGLCLLGVAGALALRAAPGPVKRRVADQVLAVLGRPDVGPPAAAATAAAQQEPARRIAPLPGMDAATADTGYGSEPGPVPRLPRQRMASPAPPLYEAAPPLYPERPDTGASPGMAAAYRALSTAPADRWPAPSPPPPGEVFRPTYEEPPADPFSSTPTVTYDAVTYDAVTHDTAAPSYHTVAPSPNADAHAHAIPNAHAHAIPDAHAHAIPNAGSEDITQPLPSPFQPPSAGEPWSAPTGGTR